ncbi:transcriptional regulator [Nitrospira sp. KM1]|uniref:hypothetical protein n=1 Tax=Nitrospira sp. KM1 TaxID=1936990 RepID=UPI0013A726F6|nr:hypothetical protein [Nitrospira sp. KM1]BCA53071.1 transcriptional regulator [Nitrospira sp. KM1]
MKPIGLITIVLCALLSVQTYAATDKDITVVRVTPSVDLKQVQYVLSHQRSEVFEQGMELESGQWDIFWRIYDQYEKEKQKIDAKRLRLLGTFVKSQGALTGDEATKLIKASGLNQQADLALRQKYFQIYSKKLNPIVAARFVQLDDMAGLVIRLAILGNVPLIRNASETEGEQAASSPSVQIEQPAATGQSPASQP